MKKAYVNPQIECCSIMPQQILLLSGSLVPNGNVNNGSQSGFGGD